MGQALDRRSIVIPVEEKGKGKDPLELVREKQKLAEESTITLAKTLFKNSSLSQEQINSLLQELQQIIDSKYYGEDREKAAEANNLKNIIDRVTSTHGKS